MSGFAMAASEPLLVASGGEGPIGGSERLLHSASEAEVAVSLLGGVGSVQEEGWPHEAAPEEEVRWRLMSSDIEVGGGPERGDRSHSVPPEVSLAWMPHAPVPAPPTGLLALPQDMLVAEMQAVGVAAVSATAPRVEDAVAEATPAAMMLEVDTDEATTILGQLPWQPRAPAGSYERGTPAAQLRRSAGGRILLALLHAKTPEQLAGLHTVRAQQLVAQFYRYAFAALLFAGLAAVAAAWLLERATEALVASRGMSNCEGPLRDWWLQRYLWLQVWGWASLPVALYLRFACPLLGERALRLLCPAATGLPLVFCSSAAACIPTPVDCPVLSRLPTEAAVLQVVHLAMLMVSGLYVIAGQPVVKRLDYVLIRSSVCSEALALAAAVPEHCLPDSEECVICLGCAEEDSEFNSRSHEASHERDAEFTAEAEEAGCEVEQVRPRWRQTHCGHRFHERCLHEWLRRAPLSAARRCPVCRSRLRHMHAAEDPAPGRRARRAAYRITTGEVDDN